MKTFHYVRHGDVETFHKLGWLNHGPLPWPHGEYSVSMEWLCNCPLKTPKDRVMKTQDEIDVNSEEFREEFMKHWIEQVRRDLGQLPSRSQRLPTGDPKTERVA